MVSNVVCGCCRCPGPIMRWIFRGVITRTGGNCRQIWVWLLGVRGSMGIWVQLPVSHRLMSVWVVGFDACCLERVLTVYLSCLTLTIWPDTLHYLTTGGATLKFVARKQEFLLPLVLVLRALSGGDTVQMSSQNDASNQHLSGRIWLPDRCLI